MEKENTQSQELQKLVETWGAMQRFAFYKPVKPDDDIIFKGGDNE